MNLTLFGLIVMLGVFLPNTVFGELPEYCNKTNDGVVCEIIIFSNKYPLPDYTPDIANVPNNAKIIFKNEGFIVHTATSTDASDNENTYYADKGVNGIFDTGKLLAGEMSGSITLDEGKYHYYCTIHKEMRGTLVVYEDVKNEEILNNDSIIPQWIKNNAEWWAEDIISDSEFVLGIKFLIENKILHVADSNNREYNIENIPQWMKNNAGWWANEEISDAEFLSTIQHLIKRNIVQVTPNLADKTLQSVPATSGAIVNFYVNDNDLNTSHNGIDEIPTDGLVIATLNGQEIPIPSIMTETEPNSGRFYLKITLPQMINGEPLSQDDIIEVRYFDQSDSVGQTRTVVSSTTLSKSFAKIGTQGNNQRIGHEFVLRLYEPDANRDSKDEDRIPLSLLEFRAEGGIRVPLSDSAFDANASFLIETGENTDLFEVKIKIPRITGIVQAPFMFYLLRH